MQAMIAKTHSINAHAGALETKSGKLHMAKKAAAKKAPAKKAAAKKPAKKAAKKR